MTHFPSTVIVFDAEVPKIALQELQSLLPDAISICSSEPDKPAIKSDTSLTLYFRATSAFDYSLSLVSENYKQQTLHVDFSKGALGYRIKHSNNIKQPLAKAMGLKHGKRPKILDATAGLGKDSFVLASLGCEITLCERNPVVYALLNDGLRRARLSDLTINTAERMKLIQNNSVEFLHSNNLQEEVVYIDPMYPHRQKHALVKKEMRIIRSMIGDDLDASELLDAALKCGIPRIVVKRPSYAKPLNSIQPSVQFPGKTTRFDVYIPKTLLRTALDQTS